MAEGVDYKHEAEEWKRWAGVLFRIGISLCVCLIVAAGLLFYLLWKVGTCPR